MVLRKSTEGYWKNLIILKDKEKMPGFIRPWFEMRKRFKDELKEHIKNQEEEVNIKLNT